MPACNICLKILKFKLAVVSQPDVSNEDRKKQNGLHFPFSVLVIFETSQAVPRKNVHLSGIRPAGDNSVLRKQPTFGEATTGFLAK